MIFTVIYGIKYFKQFFHVADDDDDNNNNKLERNYMVSSN